MRDEAGDPRGRLEAVLVGGLDKRVAPLLASIREAYEVEPYAVLAQLLPHERDELLLHLVHVVAHRARRVEQYDHLVVHERAEQAATAAQQPLQPLHVALDHVLALLLVVANLARPQLQVTNRAVDVYARKRRTISVRHTFSHCIILHKSHIYEKKVTKSYTEPIRPSWSCRS